MLIFIMVIVVVSLVSLILSMRAYSSASAKARAEEQIKKNDEAEEIDCEDAIAWAKEFDQAEAEGIAEARAEFAHAEKVRARAEEQIKKNDEVWAERDKNLADAIIDPHSILNVKF